MRGQKTSLRSSVSEALFEAERRCFNKSEEDDTRAEEIEAAFEKGKRKSFNENQKRFRESRGESSLKGKKKSKKQKGQNQLGIPISDFIYFGPGPRRRGFPHHFNSSFHNSDEKEAKYKITRSKGKAYRLEKTLASHVFRILTKHGGPMHVNSIIVSLQKLGFLKDETHHTYSIVYRTLTRNLSIFERTDRATFSLRLGFIPQTRPEKIERPLPVDEEFTSLQQLVMEAFSQVTTPNGSSPSDVYQFLKTLGFNGPYKTIYEAMQSLNFRRVGYAYYLADTAELVKVTGRA